MKYAISLAALAIVCVFLIGEAAIPGAVSTRLEKAIVANVDEAGSVRVYVRTFPALAVALGRIDFLRVDARDISVDGLRVQRLFLDARHADVDMRAVLRGGKLEVRHIAKGDVTVILAEDALNDYFHSRDGVLRLLTVKLRPGVATVSGSANLLGVKVDVALDGRFVVQGDTRLAYVVDRFRVGSTVVPEVIKDGLLKSVDLSVDVSRLPLPLVLRDVSVQDGVIYIFGGTPPVK
ncbi:MAG: DUF2993 domain-containing protein [Bacillota bacterium]|nr:DUF2993 domain-containing protein [Bacillota bacterium]